MYQLNMTTKAKKRQEDRYNDLPVEKKQEIGRLDLNDLLKRRTDELKNEKKTNFYIISGVVVLGAVVVSILSL